MGLDIWFIKTQKRERPLESYDELRKDLNNDIAEDVAYFRKVNFIMGQFDFDENLVFAHAPLEKINQLREKCNDVLTRYRTHPDDWVSFAHDTLPTTSGFFFGSTDYNKSYIGDVEEVLNEIVNILSQVDFELEDLYVHAWW